MQKVNNVTAAVDHEKHVDSKQNKGMQSNQVTKRETKTAKMKTPQETKTKTV